jgi:Domain of unknown function (DUF4340)
MKARTTLILAVLAAGLLFIALKANQSSKSRESIASGPIFPGLTGADVADIQLTAGDDMVHMIKNPDGWLVTTEGNNKADTLAVKALLEKVDSFDRKYLRSTSPEKQATFEVDDASGTEVILANAVGKSLAHFRIGKNGADYRSQFIRPVDSNEVYLIPEYLKSIFDASRPTWRDKTLFIFDSDKVKELLISPAEGEPLTLTKTLEGNFVMSLPESAAVIKNIVDASVRNLSTLRCDDFPDSLPSLSDAGLDPPLQQITAKLDDGAAFTLYVGHETESGKFYVSKRGDDTIALLSKGRIGSLIHTAQELIEQPPAPVVVPEAVPQSFQMPVMPEGSEEHENTGPNGGAE